LFMQLNVWRKLGFTVRISVGVTASCHSGVLATSFVDVIDFLCFER